jgi:hypothetical protein
VVDYRKRCEFLCCEVLFVFRIRESFLERCMAVRSRRVVGKHVTSLNLPIEYRALTNQPTSFSAV